MGSILKILVCFEKNLFLKAVRRLPGEVVSWRFPKRERVSKSGEIKKEGVIDGETHVVLQESYLGRKALRVIPRGKQWLTVYRAHQVRSYPEMVSFCLSMRCSQKSDGGKIFA